MAGAELEPKVYVVPEEIAKEMELTPEKVREIQKYGQEQGGGAPADAAVGVVTLR